MSEWDDALTTAARRLGQWKQTRNDERVSVWEAGSYRLVGTGYLLGRSLRRRWVLYRGEEQVSQPSRASEGKRDAVADYAQRVVQPQASRRA